MSFGVLLSLVFVCAKLLGLDPVVDWSWWGVFIPLYVEAVVDVIIVVVFFKMFRQ